MSITFWRCILFLGLVQNGVFGAYMEVTEDQVAELTCAEFQVLDIQIAFWTDKFLNDSCTLYKTEEIQEKCQGIEKCEIKADREYLGDGCDHEMILEIKYECFNISRRSKRGFHFLPNRHTPKRCPGRHFEDKHLYIGVASNRNAREKAASADSYRQNFALQWTWYNSVFISSQEMTYRTIDKGSKCKFRFAASKYECVLKEISWSCRYVGQFFATHDRASGHYYSDKDENRYGEL